MSDLVAAAPVTADAVHTQPRERVPLLALPVVEEEIASQLGAAGHVQIRIPMQVTEDEVGVFVV